MNVVDGTVVVTGGSGFVGRHMIKELKELGTKVRVVAWDKSRGRLEADQEFVRVDITHPQSYEEALRKLQPRWIIHLAAVAPVSQAINDPELTWQVNVVGTKVLLSRVIEHSPATKILVASSADIYGISSPTPLLELPLEQAKPRNPYAESKLAMEKIIEERFNDRVIRVRPFTHIGPGQLTGFVTADFASQIIDIERGKQESVMSVGNLESKRDFTDVRDVVRAYRLLMEQGSLGEVYHVASGEAVAIQYLLDYLLSLSKVEIKVIQDPTRLRGPEVLSVIGDATKLQKLTGWRPKISLEGSLRDIINWWRDYGNTL